MRNFGKFIIFFLFLYTVSQSNTFIDKDKNGINDLFTDVNGDGINDITQQKYDHRFPYIDKNEDGINDIFSDQDGDGVNDLSGQRFRVLDFDLDGKNDITGLKYRENDFSGFRYGFIIEERGIQIDNYIDADANGMHDKLNEIFFQDMDGDGLNDFFLDRNGDGMNDYQRIKRRIERLKKIQKMRKRKKQFNRPRSKPK